MATYIGNQTGIVSLDSGQVKSDVGYPTQYATEVSGASIEITRANHCFKTVPFNDNDDRDLELKKADWQEGDWFIVRQYGDGQGTIDPEDGDVHLPDWDKTAGKGYDMYVECYKVDGSDKYFSIAGGSL